MTRLSFKTFLTEAPSHEETLTPGPVRPIRDHDHEKDLLKRKKAIPVLKTDKVEVLQLRHPDAALYYGAGTSWGRNVRQDVKYFTDYIKHHDPHLIHTIKGRKFLVYPKDRKIYNEAYEQVNPFDVASKYPEIKKAFVELAEKHKWIALLDREATEEEWDKEASERGVDELPHVNDMPDKALSTFLYRRARSGDHEHFKALVEQLTYERALKATAHDIKENSQLLKTVLDLYAGVHKRDPIGDLYELVKDDKQKIEALSLAVYTEMKRRGDVKLKPELEAALLDAMSKYNLEKVVDEVKTGRVKLSDQGWERVAVGAPSSVLELHKDNKSLVPQRWLQRAQWAQFKKAR